MNIEKLAKHIIYTENPVGLINTKTTLALVKIAENALFIGTTQIAIELKKV